MSASYLKITPFRAISNTLLHMFVVYFLLHVQGLMLSIFRPALPAFEDCLFNLANQGYCNQFVCLCVCVFSVCTVVQCVHVTQYTIHGTL